MYKVTNTYSNIVFFSLTDHLNTHIHVLNIKSWDSYDEEDCAHHFTNISPSRSCAVFDIHWRFLFFIKKIYKYMYIYCAIIHFDKNYRSFLTLRVFIYFFKLRYQCDVCFFYFYFFDEINEYVIHVYIYVNGILS